MQSKLFVVLLFVFSTPILSLAQCTPDAGVSTRGAHPAVMPQACVDLAYNETITVVSPIDTLVGGFVVPIDSMKLGTIGDLPFGFIAECGNANCTGYPPAGNEPAKECIRLIGFPSDPFPSDTLFIPVTYYVTLFGFPTPIEDEIYTLLEAFQPDTSVSQVGTTLIAQSSGATYRWLDCNDGMNPIPGQTAPSFTAVSTGSYAVEVTQNGCVSISNCYMVDILSVDEYLGDKKINIFPNPSRGNINVDLRIVNEPIEVRVYNSIGSLVLQESLKGSTLEQIRLNLPNGIYQLELSTMDGERAGHSVILQN